MQRRVGRLVWLSAIALVGCGGVDSDTSGGSTGDAESSTTAEDDASSAAQTTGAVSTSGTATTDQTSSGADTSSSTGEGDSTTGESPMSDCDALEVLVESLPRAADQAAAIQAFVSEAQYGDHGLPLRCDDDRVVFVAMGEQPRSVAGDFNEWMPEPMMQPVADAPLWIAEFEIPVPGGLYKFVDGKVFFADPQARRYGWDRFGQFSLVDANPAQGHHERWPGFSDEVEPLEPRDVRVFVPASVNAGDPAPVLYMHDGQNVFSPDAFFGGWRASQAAESLEGEGEIGPVVIVAIDNTPARLEEYSHVPDDVGDGPTGGLADDYADFVVDGVLPFIESRYPVHTGPDRTAVLGSSMGGLVSLHLARRHPDVFGYAGSMSGTLGWGTFGLDNETMIDRYAASAPRGVVVYIDSGGDGPCPGAGVDNYCENVVLVELLRSLGWSDDVDLFYRWAQGAPHNEAAWAARLPDALREWFPAQ